MKNPKHFKWDFIFTHPDRILYPEQGVTKLELAHYYQIVHDWILPYIKHRPLSLVRCPRGQGQPCFYQKHIEENRSEHVYTVAIQDQVGNQPYPYIEDELGLMTLVQLGVLEIHPWGATVDYIDKPDVLVFDIDPGPDVAWKQVVAAAFFIKEQLANIQLTSFVKTTGGKGLHVVVPIKRQYNWNEIKIFTQTFVEYLVTLKPNTYVANMSKVKRQGKIFIDYLRNQRGATAVAPYSTRAKPNATVATPLAWDELSVKIKSDTFTIKNLPKRLAILKQDPWIDFFMLKQKLRLPKI